MVPTHKWLRHSPPSTDGATQQVPGPATTGMSRFADPNGHDSQKAHILS